MYTEHPAFILPDPSTSIMRYMSYGKFADILFRSSLYFSPLSSQKDEYEGTMPLRLAGTRLLEGIPDISVTNLQEMSEGIRQYRVSMRDRIMINSWCLSEHESISMWDRYADRDGLAISSDISSLLSSFTGEHTIYVGKVHYIDYVRESLRMPPHGKFNGFHPSLHKRREYSDEREVRAIVEVPLRKTTNVDLSHQPVDLSTLTKGVILSPEAGDWLIPLIEADLDRYGIDVEVTRSLLTRAPNY